MSSTTTKTYASGDPRLAIVDDEAEQAPKFDDPYEERKYLKHRLALAFRVFSNFGLAEGVAGHITVRDPVDCNSFWVNPFGMWLVLDRVADHGNVLSYCRTRKHTLHNVANPYQINKWA